MIYTNIPFVPKSCGMNLGLAYNKFMEMLPNDDDCRVFDSMMQCFSHQKIGIHQIGKHN